MMKKFTLNLITAVLIAVIGGLGIGTLLAMIGRASTYYGLVDIFGKI